MPHRQLWSLSFAAPASSAPQLAAALEDEALALTILTPPRARTARIEALYGDKPNVLSLKARLALASLLLGIKPPQITLSETPDTDWVRKVSGDFPPLKIARWTVHGAAHRKSVSDRRRALQIDAASAFGTGEHPTTRGCLMLLDRFLKQPRHPLPPCGRGRGPIARLRAMGRVRVLKVLDIGCGSGILAMAAAKAMPVRAVAVDLDPEAVRIAAGNIRLNGLSKNIRAGRSRGTDAHLVHRHAPYDLIMANIFAGPLCRMAPAIRCHLKPGGSVILAGMLAAQERRVLSAFRAQRLTPVARLAIGEWVILRCRR